MVPISQRVTVLKKWLPGRNMSIFLGVVVSFAGLVVYDRQQTKAILKRHCDSVRELSETPLAPFELSRRVRVVIAPPPGDDCSPVIEHFERYILPILSAAAVDYELVQGTREGDLRAKIAEEIICARLGRTRDELLNMTKQNVVQTDNRGGNIIIGRTAWREFVFGLHDGWLSSNKEAGNWLDTLWSEQDQKQDQQQQLGQGQQQDQDQKQDQKSNQKQEQEQSTQDQKQEQEQPAQDQKQEQKQDGAQNQNVYRPRIMSLDDWTQSAASSMPQSFVEPILQVPCLHLLGFLKTPQRIYRFLTQRYEAELLAEHTVAMIHAQNEDLRRFKPEDIDFAKNEEQTWNKKMFKRSDADNRDWTAPLHCDSRIADGLRMY